VQSDFAFFKIDLFVLADHYAFFKIHHSLRAEGFDRLSRLGVQLYEAVTGRHVNNAVIDFAVRPVRETSAR